MNFAVNIDVVLTVNGLMMMMILLTQNYVHIVSGGVDRDGDGDSSCSGSTSLK